MNQLEGPVVVFDGEVFTHSDAGLEVAKDLDGSWQLMRYAKAVPRSVRNRAYSTIAKNRYKWFGKKNVCMLPSSEIKARFL